MKTITMDYEVYLQEKREAKLLGATLGRKLLETAKTVLQAYDSKDGDNLSKSVFRLRDELILIEDDDDLK